MIILSLQPKPYREIVSGIKKIKEIRAYIEFGQPILDKVENTLNELREKYKFTAPQSYIHIESVPLLRDDLLKRLNV